MYSKTGRHMIKNIMEDTTQDPLQPTQKLGLTAILNPFQNKYFLFLKIYISGFILKL